MLAGLLLLVALGAVTDWTIRLIVVNAKLSGQSTYIGIMNHCESSFARSGDQLELTTGEWRRLRTVGTSTGLVLPTHVRVRWHVRVRSHHRCGFRLMSLDHDTN